MLIRYNKSRWLRKIMAEEKVYDIWTKNEKRFIYFNWNCDYVFWTC
jgi:hypothetical protein